MNANQTPLVDLLRLHAEDLHSDYGHNKSARLLSQAADEIDRLRAELICVCNLLVYLGRHAEDGKYCEICEVVARARKIAAARKGEGA